MKDHETIFVKHGKRLVDELIHAPTKALIGGAILAAATGTSAGNWYVSTTGSDANPGTIEKPFANLQKTQSVVNPGDTVWIRGGTYAFNGVGANANAGVLLSKSGASDTKRICYFAYPGEKPVFDFAKLTVAATTTGGIYVTGSWLHLKGLEVCNVPQLRSPAKASNDGVWVVGASNDIFEQINSHHNQGPGFAIANGTGGHLVLNCDSHHNYDPNSSQGDGQNGDGFGLHYQKSGSPTVFRGCRSWWNSDDGFDCIAQPTAAIIENCWNALNGYIPGTTTSAPSGNGNGFKIGGFGSPPSGYPAVIPQHTVRNCVAFLNKAAGFYMNHQPGDNVFHNNTSWKNSVGFNMLGYDLAAAKDASKGIFRNNVAYDNRTTISNGPGTSASYDSWDVSGLILAASDFVTLDTAGVFGPRKGDGSLPDVKFLHPSASGNLVDKGVDIQLPFSGKAPDLGAFESGPPSGVEVCAAKAALAPTDPENSRYIDLSGRKLSTFLPGGPRIAFRLLTQADGSLLIQRVLVLDGAVHPITPGN